MPLHTIILGSLYASKPHQRKLVIDSIRAHYKLKRLEKRGIEIAKARPTGWHGESGAAKEGGHVTVDFIAPKLSKVKIITQHVYPSSNGSGKKDD
ncbi:hypothetical protein EDB85DRAFT_2143899 [Lactarius pseudohatsudake]|nr:hypothetical protein EDB85DRAFT_2143899 [Lactarius pseudohatsudake]